MAQILDAPEFAVIGRKSELATIRGFVASIPAGPRSLVLEGAAGDCQWLDAPSSRVFGYAARRLEDERVGLLVTQREGTTRPLQLEQLRPEWEITRLEIPPLTLGSLHHLVRERLGISLPRPALARLVRTTGGNPFFALEIMRSVGGEMPRGVDELAIPGSLRELVAERLAVLSPATREAVCATFALSRPTQAAI